jgi:hypothetical protein
MFSPVQKAARLYKQSLINQDVKRSSDGSRGFCLAKNQINASLQCCHGILITLGLGSLELYFQPGQQGTTPAAFGCGLDRDTMVEGSARPFRNSNAAAISRGKGSLISRAARLALRSSFAASSFA